MPRFAFHDPERLDETLALLAALGDAACLLAGWTDLSIALYRGKAIRPALSRSISDPKYRTATILTTHAPSRDSRGVRSLVNVLRATKMLG